MLVTLSGIVISVSPVHHQNACSPMLVTLLPIVTDVSPVQKENTLLPMLVTLSGIVTVVICFFEKAASAINLVPSLTRTFCSQVPLTPSRISSRYTTPSLCAFHHPVYANALSPMLSTLSEIVIDVSFLQLENALLPMVFTLFGIVIDVNCVQTASAELPMLVTLSGIVKDVSL